MQKQQDRCTTMHARMQAVAMYEEALSALPTCRMYSMYAAYLQDSLAEQAPDAQMQKEHVAESQQEVLRQLLQLCKRASEAGETSFGA